MPPRYVYWTILAGGLPTAFRAADREDLLPTFKRIQEKHPDAEMKYFARGRLWNSPDEARRERQERFARPPQLDRNWRPGGDHRDPRQAFKDAKKARNQRWRKERFERRDAGAGNDARTDPAHGRRAGSAQNLPADHPKPQSKPRPSGPAGWKPKPRVENRGRPSGPAGWKPRPSGPSGHKRSFSGERHGNRAGSSKGTRPFAGKSKRPFAGKRPFTPKPFRRKREDDES
jgi:hypothetical protein